MKYSQEVEYLPINGKVINIKVAKEWDGFYEEESERLEDDDELLAQYYKDVTRYLGVFGINKAYFEDAVQDTMVEALKCAGNIRDKTKLKYWILTIAKRVGLKYLKKGKKEEEQNCSYEEYICNCNEEIDFVSDRQIFEKASCISDEYLIELIETTLSAKEQRVILLQYIYRHKLKEIAEILNEPEGTIHSISAWAKKKLKARLEEGGYPYGR